METTTFPNRVCAQCGWPHSADAPCSGGNGAPPPTLAPVDNPQPAIGFQAQQGGTLRTPERLEGPSFAAALKPGSYLSGRRYRVERWLASGGFGATYIAHDTELKRLCVLKQLAQLRASSRRERRLLREHLRQEVAALVTLNTPGHPNIPEIYDYLERPGCLVMKYVAGKSLAELRAERGEPLPVEEAIGYARDVCAALVYMHARTPDPVLHLDVKPSNILVDETGRVWLIDFGLAQTALVGAGLAVEDRATLGTPGFTPIEQWCGMAVPRSDVYALGATLRWLLSPASEPVALSPEVAQLIEWAMATDPEGRPSAEQLLAALDAFLTRLAIPASFTPDRPPEILAFLGREGELAALTDRLNRRHLVAIAGLAGVGKTSLAVMLTSRREPRHLFWHTFHPGERAERLLRTLAAFVAGHGENSLLRLLQQSGAVEPQRFDQLCSHAIDLLRARGYLICLDDVHLAEGDKAAEMLIRRLRAAAQAGELELIVTARQLPSWAQSDEVLVLGGLADADARGLLAVRGVSLPATVVNTILASTEGNAKFLHLTADALHGAHQPMRLVADLAETNDIAGYLIREIDERLSPQEQAAMVAVAALLGYGGSRDLIEHMLDSADCWGVLARLRDRYLLTTTPGAAGVEYVQHALVRSFFYQRPGPAWRRRLHRRAGAYFSSRQRDPLHAARHFIEAEEYEVAAGQLTANVEPIISQGGAAELRALLGRLDPRQVSATMQAQIDDALSEVAILAGDYDVARGRTEHALRGALMAGAAAQEVQARRFRRLAIVCERTGAYEQALEHCREGLALALRLPQPAAELARLYTQYAAVLWRLSDFDAVEHACSSGLAALPSGRQSRRERILLWLMLARVDIGRGRYAAAVELLNQGLALARELGDDALVASVQYSLGTAYYHLGDASRAEEAYQETLDLRGALGDEPGRVEAFNGLGLVQMGRGNHQAALRIFGESAELCARLGMPGHQATALLNLGQLALDLGQADEARWRLLGASAIYTALGNRHKLAHAHYLLGDVALLQGQPDDALAAGLRALELARAVESPSRISCALRVVGEALAAQGRLGEADQRLAEAWGLQDVVGDPYDQALILAAWSALALTAGDSDLASERALHALRLAREQSMPLLVERLEVLCAALSLDPRDDP